MSLVFREYTDVIRYGDTVIAYVHPEAAWPLVVTKDKVSQLKYGLFPHNEMVGKPWGHRFPSSSKTGFVYLLYPTPELWTLNLPHRTQILYVADISLITSYLELTVGTRMLECGTGSGSFSHSIIRTIAPTGHLYTFEYHQERADKAQKEFKDHGIADLVTIECRNVCEDGFGLLGVVNAAFLDLPAPWEAIASAKEALDRRYIGRICCFSPCIEQVQKTIAKLQEEGFTDIRVFECLVKPYHVSQHSWKSLPTKSTTMNSKKRKLDRDSQSMEKDKVEEMAKEVVSRPCTQVRGHTSYLTFAILLPSE